MAQLRAACDEAQAPLNDTNAKIEAAKADLAAAEVAHDAALRAEGALFVAGQDATDATAEVNAKAADLDRLRRLMSALVAQRTEQENLVHDRGTSLSIADSAFDTLVGDIVAEVGAEIAAELIEAGTKLSLVQAKAKSLANYAVEKRWYQLGEKLHTMFNGVQIPTWQASKHPDWRAFLAALESDANAQPVQP
jgi:hypothetical protein